MAVASGGGGTNGSYGQGATTQSGTVALTSVVTGSALYASFIGNFTSMTVTSYTQINTVSGAGFLVWSGYRNNVASGSHSVVALPTGGSVFGGIVSELRNVAASAFDTAAAGAFTASTSTTANAVVSGNFTPSAAGNILISHYWGASTFARGTTLAWVAGGANDQANGAGDEYFVATGTGAVQATWTNSAGGNVNWATAASFNHA